LLSPSFGWRALNAKIAQGVSRDVILMAAFEGHNSKQIIATNDFPPISPPPLSFLSDEVQVKLEELDEDVFDLQQFLSLKQVQEAIDVGREAAVRAFIDSSFAMPGTVAKNWRCQAEVQEALFLLFGEDSSNAEVETSVSKEKHQISEVELGEKVLRRLPSVPKHRRELFQVACCLLLRNKPDVSDLKSRLAMICGEALSLDVKKVEFSIVFERKFNGEELCLMATKRNIPVWRWTSFSALVHQNEAFQLFLDLNSCSDFVQGLQRRCMRFDLRLSERFLALEDVASVSNSCNFLLSLLDDLVLGEKAAELLAKSSAAEAEFMLIHTVGDESQPIMARKNAFKALKRKGNNRVRTIFRT